MMQDALSDRFPRGSAAGVALRPMKAADLTFTEQLYASTRVEELAVTGWPLAERLAFLAQQHRAQHAHYQQHYPGMESLILEQRGNAVGRLYLLNATSEIRIVDIALLPSSRGQGIGEAILSDILADARRQGKFVSIHVEWENPARALYARLGFAPVAGNEGVYELWEWRHPANTALPG